MRHVRPLRNFVLKDSSISALFLMILCWTIFDGMLQYITPLLMSEHGFSNTVIGLLIGCSSIGGAIFDLIICKLFKNTDYRRMFLAMLAMCTIYPLILGNANSIMVFLLAMILWGFYFDLYGFGVFDYISRYTDKKEHTSSFGVVQVSRSLGIIAAPIIIGFVVIGALFYRAFIIAWIFIFIAILFYLLLLFLNRNRQPLIEAKIPKHKTNFIQEFHLWKKIGKKISLPLLITFYLFFILSLTCKAKAISMS